MAVPGFWDNQETAQETVMQRKSVQSIVEPLVEAGAAEEDLDALIEMADEDDSLEEEVKSEIVSLEGQLDVLELKT